MIRLLTLELLLFLAPFALYAAWWMGTRRNRAPSDSDADNDNAHNQMFDTARSRLLAMAGVILVFISIAILSLTGGHSPNGTYVAPHMVDGVIVPGHFEEPVPGDEEEIQP